MTNNRGSEWRKWDLHIHTPKSIVNNYGNGTSNDVWEQYIDALEHLPADIKVIGINDYLFIDGYREILKYKEQGRLQNIELILPVVEFRLSKFCGNEKFKRINYHVIFSNEITPDVIQSQFLNALTQNYTLSPDCTQQWDGVVTIDSLIDLGNKIIESVPEEKRFQYDSPLKEGFNNLNLDESLIMKKLQTCYFEGKYITAIGKTEWDDLKWDDNSIAEKKSIINKVDLVFTAAESVESYNRSKEKLHEQGVKDFLLDCSDAHNFADAATKDRLGNCNTWIKADTTFDGLKQVLFEFDERVRVQETNPLFDFEKSPFTEIRVVNDTDVFADETENISIGRCTLPLNSGLVSIIGGRGTGKSILVDYIAAGLGQNKTGKSYSKSSNVSVSRKISQKEDPISYVLSDNPNIQFVYIPQGEIKRIVEKTDVFTQNIKETIGVDSEYTIPAEFRQRATKCLENWRKLVIFLSENKKDDIEQKINQLKQFIEQVTSKENKEKLEQYQKQVQQSSTLVLMEQQIESLKNYVQQNRLTTNEKIREINNVMADWNIQIPLVDEPICIQYIETEVYPKVKVQKEKTTAAMLAIKETFSNYKGDLTTLLRDVELYQKQLIEQTQLKSDIEENEKALFVIENETLKELGTAIETSVIAYKDKIETQWKKFKNGNDDYDDDQKEILQVILGNDDLEVSVDIVFDSAKLYEILLENLDGRTWNKEKLQSTLNLVNLESFFQFVKQESDTYAFCGNESIMKLCDKNLLDVLYTRYNEFIHHNIIVKSHGKNITKLSHGQQGTVYLRLKLAANLFSKTIIYDQPEDDLDNEFIMSELVTILRRIKKYRQIILVSHNANIVVNSDSEQVIIASNDNGVLHYKSGALENTEINQEICRILEGGKEAFEKREKKYGFR